MNINIRWLNTNSRYSEFVKFCIVGALCTAVDAAIFYIAIQLTSYMIALCSGYLLSLFLNYFLTVYWTFKTTANKKNAIGIISAHIFNLFVVRMGLMSFFIKTLCMSERMAYIPTLIISVVTNFIIIKFIITKIK